jgi:hypothetical protein
MIHFLYSTVLVVLALIGLGCLAVALLTLLAVCWFAANHARVERLEFEARYELRDLSEDDRKFLREVQVRV